jgi:hypothetical protein
MSNKQINIVGQFIDYDQDTGVATMMFLDLYDTDTGYMDVHSYQKKFTKGYLTSINEKLKSGVADVINNSDWKNPIIDNKYFNIRCFRTRNKKKYFALVYDINNKRITIEDAKNHTVRCEVKIDSYIFNNNNKNNNTSNTASNINKDIKAGWCIKLNKMYVIEM